MNSVLPRLTDVFKTTWRLLTFRLRAEEYTALGWHHLVAGLLFAWIAGLGRYWDAPRGHVLQYAGLGSVVYVIVLAGVLWVAIKPLAGPGVGDYRRLLTFVALTSPPAWLYAIPVERFMEREEAASLNLVFLQVVALWRVGLLVMYLRRAVRLPSATCVVAMILPLSGLVLALASLNLEQAVFEIMGGLRDVERTSADASYAFVVMLGVLSLPVFVLSFLFWVGMAVQLAAYRKAAATAQEAAKFPPEATEAEASGPTDTAPR